jgi:hypothetical protein
MIAAQRATHMVWVGENIWVAVEPARVARI